jgi:hypothetical protein
MPWNESTKMDEKLRFVSRFLDGEKIAPLCAEFGISRVTGHKIIERYKDSGLEALTDRSRRPFRQANRLPFQVEQLIVKLKKESPTWVLPNCVSACGPTMGRLHYRPRVPCIRSWIARFSEEETHSPPSQIIRHPFVRSEDTKRLVVHRLQG